MSPYTQEETSTVTKVPKFHGDITQWREWKEMAINHFKAAKVWKYFKKDIKFPSMKDKETVDEIKAREDLEESIEVAYAKLCNILGPTQQKYVTGKNAKNMPLNDAPFLAWSNLCAQHDNVGSDAVKQQLWSDIHVTKYQTSGSIASYMDRLVRLRTELATHGETISDTLFYTMITAGLNNPAWKPFVTTLNLVAANQRNITMIEQKLKEEETSLKKSGLLNNTKGQIPIPSTSELSNVVQTNAKFKGFCAHCGKWGHPIDKCFKRNIDVEEFNPRKQDKTDKNKEKHKNKKKEVKFANANIAKIEPNTDVKRCLNESHYEFLFMAFQGTTSNLSLALIEKPQYPLFIDSGATCHMIPYLEWFCEYKALDEPRKVTIADSNSLPILGYGSIRIKKKLQNGKMMYSKIQKVAYVPKLHCCLLSVDALMNSGLQILFENHQCIVTLKNENLIVGIGEKRDASLYSIDWEIDLKQTTENEFSRAFVGQLKAGHDSNSRSGYLWHRRFGHIDKNALSFIGRNTLIDGLPRLISDFPNICPDCEVAKQFRRPFKQSESHGKYGLLDLIHSDLCGPMQVQSRHGNRYYDIYIDDYSRICHCICFKTKDGQASAFFDYKQKIENETGKKIKILRSDNGGEFGSHLFSKFLKEHGIHHQFSTAYSPQQNGVAERKNRSLLNMARAMLSDSGLPNQYWDYAVIHANFIQNRSPHSALKG